MFWVWVLHTVFRPPVPLRPALVSLGILVVMWLADGSPQRSLKGLPRPMIFYLLGLLGLAVVSVPFSVHDGMSADFLTTSYLLIFLWMLMLSSAVRSVHDVEWLLGAAALGAFVFAAGSWLRDDSGRLAGAGYYDANDLAAMLVCIVPAAAHFVRGRFSLGTRLVAGVALGFLVFAVIRTESRGGFLGLMAVGVTILLLLRAVPRRARIGALLVGGLVMGLAASQDYWERMRTILTPSADYNFSGQATSGRMEVWKRGMGYMVSGPFGVGLNAFSVAEGNSATAAARSQAGAGFKWSAPHNSFVQAAAELGVLGGFCMVALFVSLIRRLTVLARRSPRRNPRFDEESAVAGTLLTCLVGFAVSGSFVSFAYSTILYLLLGLAIGFFKVAPAIVEKHPGTRGYAAS
jgi:O-antigen ligase